MTQNLAMCSPRAAPENEAPADPGHSASHAADPESLRSYTKAKLEIANQLRTLREIVRQRGHERRLKRCEELLVKLAEDRITLAVVGQFKRGKSSLMNAIVGRALLPVGLLPLTSAITVLRYGPRERLLIRRQNMSLSFPEEFSVQQLPEFVTEKENPGNMKQVITACVELPVPFLRRGLEFVDTPGIGSAVEANTATTMGFLPECDAVLFVTSVDSPLTRDELEFLKSVSQHVRKIFFAVNKTDLLETWERRPVLDFVRGMICQQMGTEDVKVFPVSSRLGLAAKLAEDESGYMESGLADLEQTLARFLAGEKASVFLHALVGKTLGLLEQESIEVALRTRVGGLPKNVVSERVELLKAKWKECEAERREVFARIRRRIAPEVRVALMPELRTFLQLETESFLSNVERLLNRFRWQPARYLLTRCEGSLLSRLGTNVWIWLSERNERLSFASDESVRQEWQRIQSNLVELRVIPAHLFEFSRPTTDGDEFPSDWRLEVKVEPLLIPLFRWSKHISWPLATLPVFLVRSRLMNFLQTEGQQMTGAWQFTVVDFATESVGKALDALANDVERRAGEICARLLAAIQSNPKTDTPGSNGTGDVIICELEAIRQRLLELPGDSVLDPSAEDSTPKALFPRTAATQAPDSRLAPPDVAHDLKTRSCPVCNYLTRVLFDFFSRFQYDLVRDESTQQDFAVTLGFCALHTWQLASLSSPFGASVGFAKLTEHVAKILKTRSKACFNEANPLKLIRDSRECHVCRLLHEAQQCYLRVLAEFIEGQPEGRSAYANSQGVCLRHLGLWLPFLKNEQAARFVLAEGARHFEQMAEDMQSFALKNDALRRELHNEDEQDAYLRAITHLAGTRGNCSPWNVDFKL
jgi:GTP-binding protein EngB required for normal cell division